MNPAIIDACKREVALLIQSNPDLADDAELRADMIEGETGLHRVISRLIRAKVEADAMANAMKAIKDDYAARQARYEGRSADARAGIAALLEVAELPKIELPEGTASRTKGRSKVVVSNADELPQGFFAIERKPLTSEIKAALEAGENVPGASLVIGPDSATVRVK